MHQLNRQQLIRLPDWHVFGLFFFLHLPQSGLKVGSWMHFISVDTHNQLPCNQRQSFLVWVKCGINTETSPSNASHGRARANHQAAAQTPKTHTHTRTVTWQYQPARQTVIGVAWMRLWGSLSRKTVASMTGDKCNNTFCTMGLFFPPCSPPPNSS